MNQFCQSTARKLLTAAPTLPEVVYTVHVRSSHEEEFHEAKEYFGDRLCWLVFISEGAAENWVAKSQEYIEFSIEESIVDTVEWLDLLVINVYGAHHDYIAFELVDTELKGSCNRWVIK